MSEPPPKLHEHRVMIRTPRGPTLVTIYAKNARSCRVCLNPKLLALCEPE